MSNETNNENGKQSQEMIQLDPETYQALLNKLDDLETRLESKGDDDTTIDDLAKEAKEGDQVTDTKDTKDVDLEKLSQTELARHIEQSLAENLVTPLILEIQTMRLDREIDHLCRDEEYKGIFEANKKLVFEKASKNPNLSLKEACDLAFKETGKKGKNKESDKPDEKTLKGKLRHLPSPHGEKPGQVDHVEKEEPKTRRSAVERAVEDLGIEFTT